MPYLLILLFLVCTTLTFSYTHMDRNWNFLLSKDVMNQISRIENNETLSVVGIERTIDKILSKQSPKLLSRMDIPCAYSRLPMPAQWEIRNAFFNKDLSHEDKVRIITDVLSKLPPDQRYVPLANACRDEKSPKSKYFDSYNALKYEIGFTFKLSELRAHLPHEDFEAIDDALRNETLSTEDKLDVVSSRIQKQRSDVLDKLFFSRMPIYDPIIKERFQRAWLTLLFGSNRPSPFGDEEVKPLDWPPITYPENSTQKITISTSPIARLNVSTSTKPKDKSKLTKKTKKLRVISADEIAVLVGAQADPNERGKTPLKNVTNPRKKDMRANEAFDFSRIFRNALLVKHPFSMAKLLN